MKKLLLLMSLVGVATAIQAATITPSQALGLAQNFRSKSISTNRTLATTSKISTKLVHTAKSPTGDADFYVFNYSSNNGFVIVAGDDILPPIIGYAEVGAFDKQDIPENMQSWLQEMQNEIEYVKLHPEYARKAPISSKKEVKPLLTSIWDQYFPFNDLCPMFDSNTHYVSGCVATAVAQIMYYHKWPDRGTGSHSYTSSTQGFKLSADFSQSEYDWDSMIDDYRSNSSAEANYAVAKLMSDVGISVNMDYGYENQNLSSASHSNVPNALKNYFKYDKSIKSHYRMYYKDAEAWEKLIRDELDEARPVYYSGSSTRYGHAFVCDGYNTDGLFHINWGWGGSSNGYFLLAVSDDNDTTHFTYTHNQSVITHIMPATDPKMLPADKNSIDCSEFKAEWTYPSDKVSVESYTLLVERKDQQKLADTDFSKGLPNNWTKSSAGTYKESGYFRLGTNSGNGYVISPKLDINDKDNCATIVIKAKPYANDLNVNMRVSLLDREGATMSQKDIVLNSGDHEYEIVLKGAGAGTQFKIESTTLKKRVMLKSVTIYSGEGTPQLFTGITNKNYTVKKLIPEKEYGYKVKVVFPGGSESDWSNTEYAKLEAKIPDTDFSYRSRFDVKSHKNSYKNTLTLTTGTKSGDYTIYRTPNSLNNSSEFDCTPVEVASIRIALGSNGLGQYSIFYNDPMDERNSCRFDKEQLVEYGILNGHPDETINIYDYFTEEVEVDENKRAASYTYSISKLTSNGRSSTPKDFAVVPVYSGELSTPAYSPEYTIADLSKDKNRSLPVTDKAIVSIKNYQNEHISTSDLRKVSYQFYKGNKIAIKGKTATISIPENAGDYTGEFCVKSPWGENTYGTAKVNVANIDVDVEYPEFGWKYYGTDFNNIAYITDMVIKPQMVAANKPYVYYYNVWRGDEDAENLVRLNGLMDMTVANWATKYAPIKKCYPINNSTTEKLEVVDIYVDDAIQRGQTLINSSIVRMYYTPKAKSSKPVPTQKMYIVERINNLELYGDGMINRASAFTGVNDVNASSDVVDVKYYNIMGLCSNTPFNGTNIKVEKHADGSVTTTKIIK